MLYYVIFYLLTEGDKSSAHPRSRVYIKDMIELKKQLSSAIGSALDSINPAHGLSADELYTMLEYPPDTKLGDIAFPCFKLSRALRMAPPKIADSIADTLGGADAVKTYVSEITAVNGYLNFRIADSYLSEKLLGKVLGEKNSFGSTDIGKGKTVVLDYSSPNVAKPFHIGHLGTTVIGHSLKKLYEFAGYNCVGVNHLGDWGTQFGKLIVAYRLWGSKEEVEARGIDELVELYVKFHKEAEEKPELEDEARAEFTKLEQGDEENHKLWKWFIEISIAEYEKTYAQLGISFDSYAGESFYYDKTGPVVSELREKELLKLDEGASIVDLEEYSMPPCLILKKDGSTIYATRDIAAAMYRKATYDFDKCIYVTSAGQSLHFAQWFKVVELMGYKWSEDLIHVPYGTVSINGEKLSTRSGNVILLKDLFALAVEKIKEIMAEKNTELENADEIAESVGVGAIVYYYLYNNRIRDINFIMEDALSFDGNTGPYAQYTYARTCSIMQKAGKTADEISALKTPEGYELCEAERQLLSTLALFPEKVEAARLEHEPSVVARYIYDLATAFNHFYHECQILSAGDENAVNFRLMLTAASNYALGNAFELICLKKTEKV